MMDSRRSFDKVVAVGVVAWGAVGGGAAAGGLMEERLEGPEDPGKATLTEDLREDQLVNEFLRDLEEVSVVLSAVEMAGPREEAALDGDSRDDAGGPAGLHEHLGDEPHVLPVAVGVAVGMGVRVRVTMGMGTLWNWQGQLHWHRAG